MKTALDFSLKKKILHKQDYEIINQHIKISKLPNNIKKYFNKKDIIKILSFMTKDKKNESDRINLILLKKIGIPIILKNSNRKHLETFLKNRLVN